MQQISSMCQERERACCRVVDTSRWNGFILHQAELYIYPSLTLICIRCEGGVETYAR